MGLVLNLGNLRYLEGFRWETSGGVRSVNSIWLPVNLNSQTSFPHSPKGFWGLVLLALTGPHRPSPVTLTHHTPLKLLHLIPPRGGDGRGGLPVESFIFLLTSHLAAKECPLRLFLFCPFLSRCKDQEQRSLLGGNGGQGREMVRV